MARFNKFQAKTHTFHILILEECCMSSVLCKKHLFTKQKNPIFHRNNYMKAVVCRLIMFMRLKSSVSDIENSLSVPHSIKKGAWSVIKFMKHDYKWAMNDLVGCQQETALSWGGKEPFDTFGFFWPEHILNKSVRVESERRREHRFYTVLYSTRTYGRRDLFFLKKKKETRKPAFLSIFKELSLKNMLNRLPALRLLSTSWRVLAGRMGCPALHEEWVSAEVLSAQVVGSTREVWPLVG